MFRRRSDRIRALIWLLVVLLGTLYIVGLGRWW
jgi:hypothetical protein